MNLSSHLVAFGLRQVIGDLATPIIDFVKTRFTDHGEKLPQALARSHERAWQALALALDSDGLLDQVKGWWAGGDVRGVRDQMRAILAAHPLELAGSELAFRRRCLKELKELRATGLLTIDAAEVARATADVRRYSDATGLLDGACNAVARVADGLDPRHPNLAQLLRLQPSRSMPLLAVAFIFFFRREVEDDPKLAQGLTFDTLRAMSEAQEAAWNGVCVALATLDARFDELLEPLVRIEDRMDQLHQKVDQLLWAYDMACTEVKPANSFSIRSENERELIRTLLAQYRQQPPVAQQRYPELLNGLGKLQIGAGDFVGAERTFADAATTAKQPGRKAEADYNRFRAALEAKHYDEALCALREAAYLDASRFTPFPLDRYRPVRILGAGGFGTAFLCHDANFDEQVVIKTLHAGELECCPADVLREAQLLRKLHHASIIGVRDCDYVDRAASARPYLVMDYFAGITLHDWIDRHGTLAMDDWLDVARAIADAMSAAHAEGVLHRDLKPENVLVRKDGGRWEIRVIDFGLAFKQETMATVKTSASLLGFSMAGTVAYGPPEQMGRAPGVIVGPYSDVFSFGKLSCYALFKTTQPVGRHWKAVGGKLRDLLEQCTDEDVTHRLRDFGPVKYALRALDANQLAREERKNQELERHELARLQAEGETKLTSLITGIFGRTNGNPKMEDIAAAKDVWDRYHLPRDVAQRIINLTREAWIEGQSSRATPVVQPARSAHEPNPGDLLGKSLGMKFAWIPPGTFLMGSCPGEPERDDDETQHKVKLTKGFYLAVTPVTQAQWKAVIGKDNNPSRFKGDDRPVEQVSWDDAAEFCRELGKKDSHTYRLPTEAEWEYACRAGTTTPFYFGETINASQANHDGRFAYGQGNSKKRGGWRQQTTPVLQFPANAWNLGDMHGNVWEWCQDWSGAYAVVAMRENPSLACDPQGPKNSQTRVVRGGSWLSVPHSCRAAARRGLAPAGRYSDVGFRPLLCVE